MTHNRHSYSLIISVLLHVGVLMYYVGPSPKIATFNKLSKPVVSSKKWKKLELSDVKVISPKKVAELKRAMNRQIVASEQTGKKEAAKNTRFLGETTQSFDRQTIARTNGSFKAAGKGSLSGVASPTDEVAATNPTKTKPTTGLNKQINWKDLGSFAMAKPQDVEPKKVAIAKEQLGVAHGEFGKNGLAQNNDFVEEVPLGDTTNLNTTEFKYYGFYARIRQKLEQHWGSTIQSKAKSLYKTGRRLPASENLITAIAVTLDDRGRILDIKIEGTSGIRELDQAAIESFNKAGPFPNPPKGLIVDGRATIQWGFVVKS